MAIKIKKEESGSFAKVTGVTVDPIPVNSFICGETLLENKITIFNPDQNVNGDPRRVLFNVPFEQFVKSDDTVPVDVNDLAADINAQLQEVAPTDISAGYKGIYFGDTNTPDLATDIADYNNGNWFFVDSASGVDIDLGNGIVTLEQNDQVKLAITYDADGVTELSREWTVIKDTNAKISAIEGSSINAYDIVVDADYLGDTSVGSALQPYKDFATAIANSASEDNILVKGIHIISAEIVLPHSLNFYGTDDAEIKYASYNASNGSIFTFEGNGTQKFTFEHLTFKNAGGYALRIKKTDEVNIRNCEFFNNAWSGQGLHTVVDSTTSGVLGYDSSQVDLQAFYAGSEVGDGGAVRLEECRKPLIRESRAEGNLRGFRVQDCGINGGGFLIENQSIGNLDSGIYLAVGSLGGCQNITVAINYSAYNANNGLLAVGGINNKFSQNEVYGNWNAGFCGWGSANLTLRDSGLYDNNRSEFNGIGNTGDAKASIQLNDSSSFLETAFQTNDNARFLYEILDTQVHYTGLGSNTDKVGVYLDASLSALPDNDKNIIKIDDVGFIGQDYAVDFSEVDLSNLRVSLGDNSYQSITKKAVNAPLDGMYNELPYSNHVMQVPELDIVVDTIKQFVSLHEGVGGNVINTYDINELQSVNKGTHIDIIQLSSNKIQLRGLTLGNVYVNGQQAGTNLQTMNDTVNAAFNMSLVQFQDFIKSDVFDYTEEGSTYPAIVETNEPVVDGVNYNASYVTESVADGNGQTTLIAAQNGDNKADVWSNVPMNQIGEYSTFQTNSFGGGKRFYVGFSRDSQLSSLGDGSGNGSEGIQWALAVYDGYNAPWTFYGDTAQFSYGSFFGDKEGFRNHSGILTQKVTWKIGIEDDGKMYLHFWSILDGEWKYLCKTNYTLVNDDYHPVVRFYTQGGGFYNGFDNHRFEEEAVQPTFYYIESPDGTYHYPLFKTEEEADAVDELLGGTGSSHTHTYVDDLTGTTWYMPDVSNHMSSSVQPTDGDYTAPNGQVASGVTWNIQATDDDSNYAPSFTDITYTVQEGSSVNIQYKPQGDTNYYNVTNVPTGYVDTGYSITGTADAILDGVDVVHTMNITKANDYGSVTGTITLTITDDPANNSATILTNWSKAIDFSGSNQHLRQAATNTSFNAIRMNALALQAPNNSDVSKTSDSVWARPWACSIVFKSDGNNSNQHIWNSGEGSGSNDDNIYLRVASDRRLYFGWGRGSSLNELYIGTITNNRWYGIYVAHKGARFSSSNATSTNLANAFDVKLMSAVDGFTSISDHSSVAEWGNTGFSTIGGRMDRAVLGDFTIGGRGSNRNFHGQVASVVVTTLRVNVEAPTDAEVKLMITDPKQWEIDYRIGEIVRASNGNTNVFYNANGTTSGYGTTQIWLMGDGTSDNLMSNGIRNQVYPNDQNYTKLFGNSLQSNDTVNVNINGLS
ncbi:fiber Ig/hemolysin [uncultured Mediterranean phage uvMED]|nr:fiber Ig/hemolysin [uncultured Mediterranean phage uvMED]